jgi:hypothetical protein
VNDPSIEGHSERQSMDFIIRLQSWTRENWHFLSLDSTHHGLCIMKPFTFKRNIIENEKKQYKITEVHKYLEGRGLYVTEYF